MSDKRLFFALWPDDRQRERLRDTMSPVARQVEGNAVYRANWHVTLVFVGNFPASRVPELHQATESIAVDPFRLRFDRLAFWQRPRIACLQAMSVPPPDSAKIEFVGVPTLAGVYAFWPESAENCSVTDSAGSLFVMR